MIRAYIGVLQLIDAWFDCLDDEISYMAAGTCCFQVIFCVVMPLMLARCFYELPTIE